MPSANGLLGALKNKFITFYKLLKFEIQKKKGLYFNVSFKY